MTPPADAGIAPLVRDDADMPEPSDTTPPVEGPSDEQLAAGEDYLSIMRTNLETLRDGLGCR